MAVKCKQMKKWGMWKVCVRRDEWWHKMAAEISIKRHPGKERRSPSHRQSSVPTSSVGQHALLWWAPSPGSLSLLCLTRVCVCVHVWVSQTCFLKTSIRCPSQLALSLSYTSTHANPLLLSTLIMWFPSDSQRGVPFGIPDAELHADWPIGSPLMKMRIMIFFSPFHKHHQPP